MFPLNERLKVEIPTVIPDGAQRDIIYFLARQYGADLPRDWDWSWMTTKGEYQGTLPKRLSKYVFQTTAKKLTSLHVQWIGNLIGHDKDVATTIVEFDITDSLTWPGGKFGDSGSCYWGSHFHDRYLYQTSGGKAIRTYLPVMGRSWLYELPLRTIFTELKMADYNKSAYLLFNGYGYGSGSIRFARVLATYLGYMYKRVGFGITPHIYVNGRGDDNAFLVFPMEYSNNQIRDLVIQLNGENYEDTSDMRDICVVCMDTIGNLDKAKSTISEPDLHICRHCIKEHDLKSCSNCGGVSAYVLGSPDEDYTLMPLANNPKFLVCESCRDDACGRCDGCGGLFFSSELLSSYSKRDYHYYYYCDNCKSESKDEDSNERDEE